jgi:MFS family permease
MSAQAEASPWRELAGSGRLRPFLLLCAGTWLHAADSFLAATTLPPAIAEIGGVAFINWAVALYQLGGIVAGAGCALASRRIGMRAVLAAAALCYALGCAASAAAPDMAVMLAGRLLQGIGGGVMIALTYVATSALFPRHLMTRLMAIVSAIWGASSLVGPLIGGLFADAGLWRGAYWAFGAQAALLAVAALAFLGDLPPPSGTARGWPVGRLALLSAAVLAIAAAGIAHGPYAAGLAVAGIVLLVAAARADARSPARLMPVGLTLPGTRMFAGLTMVLCLAAGTSAFSSYGPLLATLRFGATPLAGGAMLAAASVTWTAATLTFAGMSPARAGLLLRTGAACLLLGGAVLAVAMAAGPVWLAVAALMLQGAGFGMSWPFIVQRIINVADPAESDLAAGGTATMQRIGYALGASASGIAANAAGIADGASAAVAAAWAVFGAAVPLLLAGLALCFALTRKNAQAGAK